MKTIPAQGKNENRFDIGAWHEVNIEYRYPDQLKYSQTQDTTVTRYHAPKEDFGSTAGGTLSIDHMSDQRIQGKIYQAL